MTPIDNNNGSYTFCYNPVKTGPGVPGRYVINITFGGIAVDKGRVQQFVVTHAPADPGHTFATWGELPDCFNSPVYCVGPIEGVFVARFNRYGHLIGNSSTPRLFGKVFDFSMATGYRSGQFYDGGYAEFAAYIATVAPTDYLAIATGGDFNTATHVANMVKAGLIVKPQTAQLSQFALGNTYTFVGSQSTPLVNSSCGSASFCELRTTNGTSMVSARGTDTTRPIKAGNTRQFKLSALSANIGCGPYARINSVFDETRLPAGSTNYFSLVTMDQYDNLALDAETQLSGPTWNPDFTQPQGNRPPGIITYERAQSKNGYFQYSFMSYRAGDYQVNIYLNGQNINGSYYRVTITPGLANVTTSTGLGPALTTTVAGSNAPFTLLLNDKVNNTINFINPDDQISGFVYQVNQNGVVQQTIPLTLLWGDDPVAGCTQCVLQASYNATVASTPPTVSYVMNVTMNGETATYALPNVVPAQLYPPLCVIDISALPPLNPAGKPLLFSIQAKDRFGNNRTIPNAAGELFDVAPNVTANGPITVTYAGSGGIYNAQFKPKKKGPLLLNVTVTRSSGSPLGTFNVGVRTIAITPGPADPYFSYAENIPLQEIAGVFFQLQHSFLRRIR